MTTPTQVLDELRGNGLWSLLIFAVCLSWSVAASSRDVLVWQNITRALERGALCNDFSPAGYFIRKGSHLENKWVIFLESGGGCGSPKSCTERFISQNVRSNYQHYDSSQQKLITDVDSAYRNHAHNRDEFTSKLMTSLWNFQNSPLHRKSAGENFTTTGKDFLSPSQEENPLYFNFTHVLIPYCSSDLWLGGSDNYQLAFDPNFRFRFSPNETQNEFTFRGEAIFKGVMNDLWDLHGLEFASDVVLSGSSAGGVGVLNYASWVEQKLRTTGAELAVVFDSSWFINFQGNIEKRLSPSTLTYLGISQNHTCNDITEGYPCCMSAQCLLSNTKYFPRGVPSFALFSLYDLYFLTESLKSVSSDRLFDALRIAAEYGGEMNTTLTDASLHNPSLSYFIPSCLQHVYFATSSLWEGLLRDSGISEEINSKQFGHLVQSGVWTSLRLTETASSHGYTIQEALIQWEKLRHNGSGVLRLRDNCKGPHCNHLCPETIVLSSKLPYLHPGYQWILAGIVLCVSLLCVVVKIVLVVVMRRLDKDHQTFLNWLNSNPYKEHKLAASSGTKAISVACWRLKYWVRLSKKDLKKAESSATITRGRLLSIAAAYDSDAQSSVSRSRRISTMRSQSESTGPSETQAMELAQSVLQFNALRNDGEKRGFFSRSKKENKWQSGKDPSSKEKRIIQGISTFFKPGELVAIMGPSGSGKTTFLDLLTGRRRTGRTEGLIYVNGIAVDQVREWYLANTGYVLQLASPYYEELTVRENLMFAAQMRLPRSFKVVDRFMRIEQVMNDTGLLDLANTVVGGATGAGLSGGQKRRLCVAIQLLSLPSLLFLDEPTSGLDATSSYELLCYLKKLANYNRSIILTIHQPRLEIFNMFRKIILLCQGRIAYHGSPEKAYDFFVSAHNAANLKLSNIESKNPADVIMDMLGKERSRAAILSHYDQTGEPAEVDRTIGKMRITGNGVRRRLAKDSGFWNRILSLEGRAMKRSNLGTQLYLPVIFIGYSVLLGTVYAQSESGTQVISGFGVFSCASGLFMFPLIYGHLFPAVTLFKLEHADGVGKSLELVLQTFVRFISLSFLPLVLCAVLLYLLVVPVRSYDFVVVTQVAIFNLAMNQTWISLLILIICLTPTYCHRLSPVVSAVAGFAGGFFVPPSLMPPWYVWLFYINPNYYGFTAMARLLLNDLTFRCAYSSELECYPFSADYILEYFGLNNVQPFVHVLILFLMTAVYLALAWLVVWLKHAHIKEGLARTRKAIREKFGCSSESDPFNEIELQSGIPPNLSLPEEGKADSEEEHAEETTEEKRREDIFPDQLATSTHENGIDPPAVPSQTSCVSADVEDYDDVFEINGSPTCSSVTEPVETGPNLSSSPAHSVIHPRCRSGRSNFSKHSWRNQCISGHSVDLSQEILERRARLWDQIEAKASFDCGTNPPSSSSLSHDSQVTLTHEGDKHMGGSGLGSPANLSGVVIQTPTITIEESPSDEDDKKCFPFHSSHISLGSHLVNPTSTSDVGNGDTSMTRNTSLTSLETITPMVNSVSEESLLGSTSSSVHLKVPHCASPSSKDKPVTRIRKSGLDTVLFDSEKPRVLFNFPDKSSTGSESGCLVSFSPDLSGLPSSDGHSQKKAKFVRQGKVDLVYQEDSFCESDSVCSDQSPVFYSFDDMRAVSCSSNVKSECTDASHSVTDLRKFSKSSWRHEDLCRLNSTGDPYEDGDCVVYPVVPLYRFQTISGSSDVETTEV